MLLAVTHGALRQEAEGKEPPEYVELVRRHCRQPAADVWPLLAAALDTHCADHGVEDWAALLVKRSPR